MDSDEVTNLHNNPNWANADANDKKAGAGCIFLNLDSQLDHPNRISDCIFLTALVILILVGVFTVIVSANLTIVALGRGLEPYSCQCNSLPRYTSTLPTTGYMPT